MAKSQKKSLKGLLMAIVATVLLIVFLVIALLLAPRSYVPEFDIRVRDWMYGEQQIEAHGKIAVFDDKIKPGDSGSFDFILVNETGTELTFGITFTEYLETVAAAHPFMQYRLSQNDIYVTEHSEWRYANQMDFHNIRILPDTRQLFTLEWRWEFENGTDSNDTLIGRAGGELSIHFLVLAEVYE